MSSSKGIFLTQESNRGLLHCSQILYQLSYQGILVKLNSLLNREQVRGSSALQGPAKCTCQAARSC